MRLLFTGYPFGSAFADDPCSAFIEIEAKMNQELLRNIDKAPILIQVRVNCDLRSVTYVKRITADPVLLASGWKERKQRQHQQLHCNLDGIASQTGWSARDEIFDRDYQHLVTLITTPANCAEN